MNPRRAEFALEEERLGKVYLDTQRQPSCPHFFWGTVGSPDESVTVAGVDMVEASGRHIELCAKESHEARRA
jgi:hypothetical protein